MPLNIRIELSSLASKHRSGVAQYTHLLTDALSLAENTSLYGHYFDFLNRQPKPEINASIQFESNRLVPLRVYAKAQSLGFALPFDAFLPKVDLTILPNFATWPSVHSKYSATVIHDLTYIYFPEVVEKNNLAHLRRVVPRSIKEADFIITVSESVKSELTKEFDLDPNRCVVTPIPPDEIFYERRTRSTIEEAKKKYSIPYKKYLYFIGNMEPRKNLAGLIRAYEALPKTIKNQYGLVLAGGKGWKIEETEESLAHAIEHGENILHIGYVDQEDSPALYQGSSLFIMPSLYEGFGMPILEAMASHIPVLANDIPVLREVGGDAASYTDATNPEIFSTAILEILKLPINTEVFAHNLSRFSWENNVDRIVKKASELLESNR